MTKFGQYTVVRMLGRGAFGEVYEATYSSTTYAVKKIKSEGSDEKLKKEIGVLKRLRHENVVYFVESFSESGDLFIVLEYCNGGDLNSLVLRNPSIMNSTLMEYIKQIGTGLAYLHRNSIIHRDIKPDNIMITNGRGSVTVKLADFGLARIWETFNYQSPYYDFQYSPKGPPYYTAPEVYNEGKVTVKSDIFSMGCVIMALFSRMTVNWIDNKKLLAPYIDRFSKQVCDASESEKTSFIKRYIQLESGAVEVQFQALVGKMVHSQWRDRPNIEEVLSTFGQLTYSCTIL